ncbi:MAG: hypothetical protein NTY09_09405 [bacterium]|nr:hypothetical protein [bacterium]
MRKTIAGIHALRKIDRISFQALVERGGGGDSGCLKTGRFFLTDDTFIVQSDPATCVGTAILIISAI